jgi:thioredoxin-like negative regulator of GroEL
VLFTRHGCSSCNRVYAQLMYVAESRDDVRFVAVQVNESEDLANRYGHGTRAVPVLRLFRGGHIVATRIDSPSHETLDQWLDRHTASHALAGLVAEAVALGPVR